MPVDRIIAAAVLGLLLGSFLNVCIHRLPQGLSIVHPRSRCPHCHKQIRSWDNIPLFSFLLLRGRCRDCKARISLRYPLIELASAALVAIAVQRDGITILAARDAIFSLLLLALTVTDFEARILPEQLTLGGLLAGVAFSWFVPVDNSTLHLPSLQASFVGALVPAVSLWLAGWLYLKVRKREGLGFGDVLLIALIGSFLGLENTLLTLVLSSTVGSVVGLIYIKAKRMDPNAYELPLGSFLALGALAVSWVGPAIIRWYWSP